MGKPKGPQEDEKFEPGRSFDDSATSSNSQPNTGTHSGRVAETPPVNVMARPPRPERLEDVFQDDIVRRFSAQEFRNFARSAVGLRLSDYDVSNIVDDYGNHVEEMKLKMLNLWRQRQGTQATPARIRELADAFNKHRAN